MPRIRYTPKKFSAEHQGVIDTANTIISEYRQQGYDLTLRQLFYQCVSRNFLPNTDRDYKRLGTIVSDARRAGLIDWEAIVDRTRFIREVNSWAGPDKIVGACAEQFKVDWWLNQKYRTPIAARRRLPTPWSLIIR